MVTIKRAVSLGLALDATSLRREVSAVARSLRAAEDPFKSLSNQMQILEDDALQSADSLEKFEFATKKLELAFYKKQAAIKKTNEEWYRYTAAGKAAAAEEARLAKIVEDVVAIEAKHVSELDKTIQRQERLREAEREGLISKQEMIALIQAEEDAFFAASPEARKLAQETERQARADEKAAEAKRKLIAGLEATANPAQTLRTAVADLNNMQSKGEISAEAAATEYERLRKVYEDATGATKRQSDQQKVLADYEKARVAQIEKGRGVLSQQLTAEQKIEQQYREELAALEALVLEEQARGNTNGANRARNGIQQLGQDKDNSLFEERNRLSQEGIRYMSQFDTTQQRVNRRLAEANKAFRDVKITEEELATAHRAIIRENSALHQGFMQLKSAVLVFIGPLIILQKTFEGVKASITAAAELEKASARFRVFTGTVEQSNDLLAELREISARSPITFTGAQKATATMLQFGVAVKDVTRRLKQLGEITAGDNDRLQSISLAFAQVQAAGRLMGQELIQLVNAGFNPLQEISKQTGETLPELKKRMEEGRISFEEVAAAFDQATEKGGRFNGLLKEISTTTAGRIEIAKSKVEELSIAFGQLVSPATNAALESFTQTAGDLVKIFNAMKDATDAAAESMAGFVDPLNLGEKDLDIAKLRIITLIDGVATAIDLAKTARAGANRDVQGVITGIDAIDARLGNLATFSLRILEGDDAVRSLEEFRDALERIEELRKRSANGDQLSKVERAVLNQQLERERSLKRVSNSRFNELKDELKLELEKTQIINEQNRLKIKFADTVGTGFYTDEQLANIETVREQLKEIDKLEQERVDNLTRIEGSLDKQIQKYQDAINEAKKGINADALSILKESLKESDREAFQGLINQAETLADITDGINLLGIDIPQENIDKLKELLRIKAEDEARQKSAKSGEKYKEELRDLSLEIQYLRDRNTLDEDQARIKQLIRENDISPDEAKRLRAAEKARDIEKEILKIKEEADKLIEDRAKGPFADAIEGLAKLQVQLNQGFINKDLFDQERQRILDENAANGNEDINGIRAPKAIQKDSAEAFGLAADATINYVKEQIKIARKQQVTAEVNAKAATEATRILNEIKRKPGVLPA